MDNKIIIGGLLVVAMIVSGLGTTYVLDAKDEVVCRTGNGWEIVKDNGDYVEAVCPYLSKDHVYENCLPEFRATSSKERYGCNKVLLEIVQENVEPGRAGPGAVKCYTESTGRGCEPI